MKSRMNRFRSRKTCGCRGSEDQSVIVLAAEAIDFTSQHVHQALQSVTGKIQAICETSAKQSAKENNLNKEQHTVTGNAVLLILSNKQ